MTANHKKILLNNSKKQRSSFRDPSGFLFWNNKRLLRQVNISYKDNYDALMNSGLYEKLISEKLLIQHQEMSVKNGLTEECYKILKPDLIEFISYPYEWCFSQLKDAALLTLKIQKICLEHGMTLKDASAYNVQFFKGEPIFIDSLSFVVYEEGSPWIAYKQFCQHFLAPLALMAYTDIHLSKLLTNHIDGIPLDLSVKLLPKKCMMNIHVLMHLILHAKAQKKFEDSKDRQSKKVNISLSHLKGIIGSLESAVCKLHLKKQETEWGDYYSKTNYSDEAFNAKASVVEKYIDIIKPNYVWDLGANVGHFSRIASSTGATTISFDIDPVAVEKNYLHTKENKEANLLPLVLDLTNPSPAIGWNNEERMSFKDRGLPDTIIALALIHHLAISNNVPLSTIADFFCKLTNNLIIEFVPKSDSQVIRLLKTRNDIYDDYNQETFEEVFSKSYDIKMKEKIAESDRTLYLMTQKKVEVPLSLSNV